VDHAHRLGYWIRFYAVDGFAPAADQGWGAGYNFGSHEAAVVRWKARSTRASISSHRSIRGSCRRHEENTSNDQTPPPGAASPASLFSRKRFRTFRSECPDRMITMPLSRSLLLLCLTSLLLSQERPRTAASGAPDPDERSRRRDPEPPRSPRSLGRRPGAICITPSRGQHGRWKPVY